MISLADPEVTFSAYHNTLAKMEKKSGRKIALLDEAHVVPAGVVRLSELQEQSYSYINP